MVNASPEVFTAFRVVHADFASSRGYVWPFPGHRAEAPGPIRPHKGACPEAVGDGLCLAKTWRGAASGGIPASTVLICTYTAADVLGEDNDKVRVSGCDVVRVVDFQRMLREHRTDFNLPANLAIADLGGADLGGANLVGANLRSANLRSANLRGANLRGANMGGANLRGADLRGANLWGANLWGANLWGANLWGANLGGANLAIADLGGADLGGADLGGADLRGADLRGANLWGANLRGADNVDKAHGNAYTCLPDGWTVNDSGLIVQVAK